MAAAHFPEKRGKFPSIFRQKGRVMFWQQQQQPKIIIHSTTQGRTIAPRWALFPKKKLTTNFAENVAPPAGQRSTAPA
jgi:hypothetical protein